MTTEKILIGLCGMPGSSVWQLNYYDRIMRDENEWRHIKYIETNPARWRQIVNNEKALAVFENFKIRRVYDEKLETWSFSVVYIIAALIQQADYQAARNYWKVLKNRLKKEGVKRL